MFRRPAKSARQSPSDCLRLAPDPFVLLEGDRILEHSESFAHLFGLAPGNHAGILLSALLPRPGLARLQPILANPEPALWRGMALQRPDGSTRVLEWRPLPAPAQAATRWWAVRDVTSRQRLEQAVGRAQEIEQARIARDLHDNLGQKLTGLMFHLQSRSSAAPELLTPLIELTQDILRDVRDLAHSLAPVDLAPDGLAVALQHLARTGSRHFPACITFSGPLESSRWLDPATSNALYRISQEAISNAVRHGRASQIRLQLTFEGSQARLTVSDNGTGLPESLPTAGLGLEIMRHRLESVGGRLNLRSPGDLGGVTLEADVRAAMRSAPGMLTPAPMVGKASRSAGPARLAVIDPHAVTRAGLVTFLSEHTEFLVLGEGDSASRAIELCGEHKLDLLVTEMLLMDGSALDYVSQLRRLFPTLRITVLSLYPADQYERAALEAGADLYIEKGSPPDHLLAALRALAAPLTPSSS